MFYRFDNEWFNYHGRWECTADGMRSHWVRPYVEFYCDGDFAVSFAEDPGRYSVWINGEFAEAQNGVYKISENSLIRIVADETSKTVLFKGVETDGSVGFARSREKNVLMIGDSLTHSDVGYSVLLPKAWNCDYTCIAQGSMALCVDRGYVNVQEELNPYKGMSVAFFYLNNICEGVVPMKPFDFSNDCKYDAVILNIGTNDHLTDETYVEGFATVYREFIKKLNEFYHDIPIYLVLPSADTVDGSGWRRNTIEICAKEAEALYPNVTYISSRGWDVEICDDNVHPTTEGYRVFAEELMKAIGKI